MSDMYINLCSAGKSRVSANEKSSGTKAVAEGFKQALLLGADATTWVLHVFTVPLRSCRWPLTS